MAKQANETPEQAVAAMAAELDQAMAAVDARLTESREAAIAHNQGALPLVDSWLHSEAAGDPSEQAETLAYLQAALDANRPPGQKLFS